MFALRIVDQRNSGLTNDGELSDLARMVHAHLDGGIAVSLAQLQQHQRHTDVIVQITARRQHTVAPSLRAQNRRQHFLDRRLAIATGKSDQRNIEATAPMRTQRRQRLQRAAYHYLRYRRFNGVLDQRGHRTGFGSLGNKSVGVKALAL